MGAQNPSQGVFTGLSVLTVLSCAVLLCLSLPILVSRLLNRGTRLLTPAERGIAQYGKAGDQDFHKALIDGYSNHKDSFFTVPMDHHPMTIVPGKFIDEIKALPENILSFQKQVTARFLGKYTGLGVNDTLVHSVKYDLTRNIPNILPELQDEVGYSINKHIGECQDWTPYPLYHMFLHLVALLSGRIFVGHPLSRDETWLAATIAYTVDGFTGAEKLWKYPTYLHPIMQYILPEVRKVHSYLAAGSSMLAPVIKGRRANPEKFQHHNDMVQWIINNSHPSNKDDVNYVTKTQMLISVVAIHTTTMTMTQVIFDLLAHPEYIDILREEIKQVRPDETAPWTKHQIAGLRKMDSFMKESQRFRPPGLLTMNREVQQDIKLSNGLVLPKGDHIAIAAGSNAIDPEMFEDPQKFDGLRFAKLRELPGNENKYQFVTVGPDQLHWGAGTHACPGRFFATYEIKMLLSKILIDYDIKLPDGSTNRPQDIAIDIRVVPSMSAQVMFKKRHS